MIVGRREHTGRTTRMLMAAIVSTMVPINWWHKFKENYFPQWMLEKWPVRWRAGTTDAVIFGANRQHAIQLREEFIRIFNNSVFVSIPVFPLPKGFHALAWSFGSCRIFFESIENEERFFIGRYYRVRKFYDHYAEEQKALERVRAFGGSRTYGIPMSGYCFNTRIL